MIIQKLRKNAVSQIIMVKFREVKFLHARTSFFSFLITAFWPLTAFSGGSLNKITICIIPSSEVVL